MKIALKHEERGFPLPSNLLAQSAVACFVVWARLAFSSPPPCRYQHFPHFPSWSPCNSPVLPRLNVSTQVCISAHFLACVSDVLGPQYMPMPPIWPPSAFLCQSTVGMAPARHRSVQAQSFTGFRNTHLLFAAAFQVCLPFCSGLAFYRSLLLSWV